MSEALFPYSRWTPQIAELKERYYAADPFPHIALDNFLEPGLAQQLVQEFPKVDSSQWVNYVHVNERKFGKKDRGSFAPTIGAVVDELNSPRFLDFLRALTGIEGLMADPSLEGGGLHQIPRGGFLNVHADFTVHPHHRKWRRRVNVLVYLNDNWEDSYGGKLELWDQQVKRCAHKILPILNRAVIFNTEADSFHGHPEPLSCPEGMTRKSIALYYFTEEENPLARSTEYRARPGDGARGLLIYLDKMVVRAYDKVKRVFNLDDDFASKVLRLLSRSKPN